VKEKGDAVVNIEVIYKIKSKNAEDALKQMSALLFEKDYVKKSYSDAIIEREKKFPTGLKLQGENNVALPHADIEHVLKPCLAVGVLKEAVEFRNMADPEEIVENVKMIFIPVITEANKYVEFLGFLVDNVFQEPETMKKLTKAKTKSEILEILKEKLKEI
jgi:PTS system galactitol-specific IIA component